MLCEILEAVAVAVAVAMAVAFAVAVAVAVAVVRTERIPECYAVGLLVSLSKAATYRGGEVNKVHTFYISTCKRVRSSSRPSFFHEKETAASTVHRGLHWSQTLTTNGW